MLYYAELSRKVLDLFCHKKISSGLPEEIFRLFLNIYLRYGVHLLSLFKNNEQMFDYCSHFRYNEIILIAYY